jgi:large subunit ribosomal protein L9
MKVILVKDIAGFGRSGDVKEVSDGHGRNYLIPKGLALPATTSALDKIQKEAKEKQDKLQRIQAQSLELKNRLSNKTISITSKADKKRLFASIHEQEIANAINTKLDISLAPKQVIIKNQIKTIGTHEVEIKLTENLHAKVKIEVKVAQ